MRSSWGLRTRPHTGLGAQMLKTLAATWGPTLGQWAPWWPVPAGSNNPYCCILGLEAQGNMEAGSLCQES